MDQLRKIKTLILSKFLKVKGEGRWDEVRVKVIICNQGIVTFKHNAICPGCTFYMNFWSAWVSLNELKLFNWYYSPLAVRLIKNAVSVCYVNLGDTGNKIVLELPQFSCTQWVHFFFFYCIKSDNIIQIAYYLFLFFYKDLGCNRHILVIYFDKTWFKLLAFTEPKYFITDYKSTEMLICNMVLYHCICSLSYVSDFFTFKFF